MDGTSDRMPIAASVVPGWLRSSLRGPIKRVVRRLICEAVDVFDFLTGRRERLLPPCRLRVRVGCFLSFVNARKFKAVAEEFLRDLRSIAKLEPSSRVLDIGCGCGQMAVPIAALLDGGGSYDGFDPDREAIEWCGRIHEAFPQARFHHADLQNAQYNPGGGVAAENFSLPFPGASYDLILLKSVFTHLLIRSTRNYLGEIRRLLKPEGTCVASFYLLDEEALRSAAERRSAFTFPFELDGCLVSDPATPEYLVAYGMQTIRGLVEEAGLEIVEPVHYGSWSGRKDFLSFQDLVVLRPEMQQSHG
jgi:SAM-dependent methyltransferase